MNRLASKSERSGDEYGVDLGLLVYYASLCALHQRDLPQLLRQRLDRVEAGHFNKKHKETLRSGGWDAEVETLAQYLGVHIGIGAGAVQGFHVGGIRNRWEYFITGLFFYCRLASFGVFHEFLYFYYYIRQSCYCCVICNRLAL